jgi:hypothetical protein
VADVECSGWAKHSNSGLVWSIDAQGAEMGTKRSSKESPEILQKLACVRLECIYSFI